MSEETEERINQQPTTLSVSFFNDPAASCTTADSQTGIQVRRSTTRMKSCSSTGVLTNFTDICSQLLLHKEKEELTLWSVVAYDVPYVC